MALMVNPKTGSWSIRSVGRSLNLGKVSVSEAEMLHGLFKEVELAGSSLQRSDPSFPGYDFDPLIKKLEALEDWFVQGLVRFGYLLPHQRGCLAKSDFCENSMKIVRPKQGGSNALSSGDSSTSKPDIRFILSGQQRKKLFEEGRELMIVLPTPRPAPSERLVRSWAKSVLEPDVSSLVYKAMVESVTARVYPVRRAKNLTELLGSILDPSDPEFDLAAVGVSHLVVFVVIRPSERPSQGYRIEWPETVLHNGKDVFERPDIAHIN